MMISGKIPVLLLALVTTATPTATSAAEAIAQRSGAVRAGPQSAYPLITWVRRGQHLDVYGCLKDGNWCDVALVGSRGWFPATRLMLSKPDQQLTPARAGADLPVVEFDKSEYWRNHYGRRTALHEARPTGRAEESPYRAAVPPIPLRPPNAEALPYKPRPESWQEARKSWQEARFSNESNVCGSVQPCR